VAGPAGGLGPVPGYSERFFAAGYIVSSTATVDTA